MLRPNPALLFLAFAGVGLPASAMRPVRPVVPARTSSRLERRAAGAVTAVRTPRRRPGRVLALAARGRVAA